MKYFQEKQHATNNIKQETQNAWKQEETLEAKGALEHKGKNTRKAKKRQ